MKFPKLLMAALSLSLLILGGLQFAESHGLVHLGLFETVGFGGAPMLGCVSVAGISKICGSNPGGLNELFVIAVSDLEDFVEPAEGEVNIPAASIVPKIGKGFVQWDFAQDTGELGLKGSGEDGSQSFEQSVSTFIPRFTPAIAAVVQNSLNNKFIVAVRDGKGQVMIGGTLTRPMTFEMDYKSGKKFNDKNGGEYTFKCGIGSVPFFLTGTLPVVGGAV